VREAGGVDHPGVDQVAGVRALGRRNQRLSRFQPRLRNRLADDDASADLLNLGKIRNGDGLRAVSDDRPVPARQSRQGYDDCRENEMRLDEKASLLAQSYDGCKG
jgi:hypothetical protein